VSPPPRSQSRDVKKRKDRDRDREKDPRRRKAWKSRSSRSTSSSGSSRSRSKSSKQSARDKIGKQYDNRRASMSEKNITDYFDRDEEAVVAAKKGCYEIERYEMNVSLEKTENPLSRNANETEDILPDDGGSPVTENLELILRQKALENFRKFRAAAATAGKTDDGATQKEILTDSPQNAGTKVAESRSAAITPPRGQASSLGARHPTESPKSEDYGNRKSPWMQKSSAAMSHGAGSPSRILKNGDTGGLTKQGGSTIEATHSTSQPRSPQDGRNSHSVMQRLVDTPGGASSANQRLGSSAGARNVNGAPRIKSVVSIPTREGYDGGTTPQGGCENFAPVESSSEIRHALIDINKAEGTDGDDRKVSEASASNPSVLSPAEGKRQVTEARIEDKDGSQFQKKTFSRMHDGETVEVRYSTFRYSCSNRCIVVHDLYLLHLTVAFLAICRSATRSTYQRKRPPSQEGNCSAKNAENVCLLVPISIAVFT
jgi:hypothetical protein